MEDLEKIKQKLEDDLGLEITEIKKEKRRLNDLLTLREEEIDKIKDLEKLKNK